MSLQRSSSSPRGQARLVLLAVIALVALVVFAAPRNTTGHGPVALADSVLADADLRPSSAVTVSAQARSAAAAGQLKVTVSQTTNLVNQTIDVSWTGGTPTIGTPNFAVNYLQIMQCWGDTSPDRTQCEFGGKVVSDTRGGENTASRQLSQSSYVDPKEVLTKDLTAGQLAYVPFRPVKGDEVTGINTLKNPFYDQSTSNEIPYAATRGDGKGFASFEAQTFREAPGLGCGDLYATGPKKGTPRACWLVVVPRGGIEVDGTTQDAVLSKGSSRLDSSPLSQTNWDNRIVIPLKFAAVGQVCPIDAKQRPLIGVETGAESILRWQPALCRNKGPVFSFAQTADSGADRKLIGAGPGMALLNAPVPPAQVPSDRILTYAPVAVSGISVAVMVERQSPASATAEQKAEDGERITDLKLTPRLVAKMLTQSYLLDVARNALYLKDNPSNITTDPDFLALNPQFKQLEYRDSVETLAPIGLADAYTTLWRWIASDQEASDFVAGLPDPWGMRVNPFYQGLAAPRDDFPKIDPFCEVTAPDASPLCTLDRHPYTQDFHDAARSASRGDALTRFWDQAGTPPAFKKAAPQLNGQRRILAVTDSATAARFGLVTAKLQNASGQFVAPTRAALAAGLAQMSPTAVPGVLTANPEAADPAAYPLTTVTYAVTAPKILSQAEASDYALFIRYAVGAGQKPGSGLGNLPDGYLPLTGALRNRALSVAKDVQSRRGPVASAGPGGSSPGGSGSGGTGGSGSSGGGSDSAGGTGSAGTRSGSTGAATDAPTPGSATATPEPGPQVIPAQAISKAIPTPGDPKVAGRYAVLIALTLGCCALIFGLLLPRLARRLGE